MDLSYGVEALSSAVVLSSVGDPSSLTSNAIHSSRAGGITSRAEFLKASVPSFKNVSIDRLLRLASHATPISVNPGQYLVREGEEVKHVFIVEDGIATVVAENVSALESIVEHYSSSAESDASKVDLKGTSEVAGGAQNRKVLTVRDVADGSNDTTAEQVRPRSSQVTSRQAPRNLRMFARAQVGTLRVGEDPAENALILLAGSTSNTNAHKTLAAMRELRYFEGANIKSRIAGGDGGDGSEGNTGEDSQRNAKHEGRKAQMHRVRGWTAARSADDVPRQRVDGRMISLPLPSASHKSLSSSSTSLLSLDPPRRLNEPRCSGLDLDSGIYERKRRPNASRSTSPPPRSMLSPGSSPPPDARRTAATVTTDAPATSAARRRVAGAPHFAEGPKNRIGELNPRKPVVVRMEPDSRHWFRFRAPALGSSAVVKLHVLNTDGSEAALSLLAPGRLSSLSRSPSEAHSNHPSRQSSPSHRNITSAAVAAAATSLTTPSSSDNVYPAGVSDHLSGGFAASTAPVSASSADGAHRRPNSAPSPLIADTLAGHEDETSHVAVEDSRRSVNGAASTSDQSSPLRPSLETHSAAAVFSAAADVCDSSALQGAVAGGATGSVEGVGASLSAQSAKANSLRVPPDDALATTRLSASCDRGAFPTSYTHHLQLYGPAEAVRTSPPFSTLVVSTEHSRPVSPLHPVLDLPSTSSVPAPKSSPFDATQLFELYACMTNHKPTVYNHTWSSSVPEGPSTQLVLTVPPASVSAGATVYVGVSAKARLDKSTNYKLTLEHMRPGSENPALRAAPSHGFALTEIRSGAVVGAAGAHVAASPLHLGAIASSPFASSTWRTALRAAGSEPLRVLAVEIQAFNAFISRAAMQEAREQLQTLAVLHERVLLDQAIAALELHSIKSRTSQLFQGPSLAVVARERILYSIPAFASEATASKMTHFARPHSAKQLNETEPNAEDSRSYSTTRGNEDDGPPAWRRGLQPPPPPTTTELSALAAKLSKVAAAQPQLGDGGKGRTAEKSKKSSTAITAAGGRSKLLLDAKLLIANVERGSANWDSEVVTNRRSKTGDDRLYIYADTQSEDSLRCKVEAEGAYADSSISMSASRRLGSSSISCSPASPSIADASRSAPTLSNHGPTPIDAIYELAHHRAPLEAIAVRPTEPPGAGMAYALSRASYTGPHPVNPDDKLTHVHNRLFSRGMRANAGERPLIVTVSASGRGNGNGRGWRSGPDGHENGGDSDVGAATKGSSSALSSGPDVNQRQWAWQPSGTRYGIPIPADIAEHRFELASTAHPSSLRNGADWGATPTQDMPLASGALTTTREKSLSAVSGASLALCARPSASTDSAPASSTLVAPATSTSLAMSEPSYPVINATSSVPSPGASANTSSLTPPSSSSSSLSFVSSAPSTDHLGLGHSHGPMLPAAMGRNPLAHSPSALVCPISVRGPQHFQGSAVPHSVSNMSLSTHDLALTEHIYILPSSVPQPEGPANVSATAARLGWKHGLRTRWRRRVASSVLAAVRQDFADPMISDEVDTQGPRAVVSVASPPPLKQISVLHQSLFRDRTVDAAMDFLLCKNTYKRRQVVPSHKHLAAYEAIEGETPEGARVGDELEEDVRNEDAAEDDVADRFEATTGKMRSPDALSATGTEGSTDGTGGVGSSEDAWPAVNSMSRVTIERARPSTAHQPRTSSDSRRHGVDGADDLCGASGTGETGRNGSSPSQSLQPGADERRHQRQRPMSAVPYLRSAAPYNSTTTSAPQHHLPFHASSSSSSKPPPFHSGSLLHLSATPQSSARTASASDDRSHVHLSTTSASTALRMSSPSMMTAETSSSSLSRGRLHPYLHTLAHRKAAAKNSTSWSTDAIPPIGNSFGAPSAILAPTRSESVPTATVNSAVAGFPRTAMSLSFLSQPQRSAGVPPPESSLREASVAVGGVRATARRGSHCGGLHTPRTAALMTSAAKSLAEYALERMSDNPRLIHSAFEIKSQCAVKEIVPVPTLQGSSIFDLTSAGGDDEGQETGRETSHVPHGRDLRDESFSGNPHDRDEIREGLKLEQQQQQQPLDETSFPLVECSRIATGTSNDKSPFTQAARTNSTPHSEALLPARALLSFGLRSVSSSNSEAGCDEEHIFSATPAIGYLQRPTVRPAYAHTSDSHSDDDHQEVVRPEDLNRMSSASLAMRKREPDRAKERVRQPPSEARTDCAASSHLHNMNNNNNAAKTPRSSVAVQAQRHLGPQGRKQAAVEFKRKSVGMLRDRIVRHSATRHEPMKPADILGDMD